MLSAMDLYNWAQGLHEITDKLYYGSRTDKDIEEAIELINNISDDIFDESVSYVWDESEESDGGVITC